MTSLSPAWRRRGLFALGALALWWLLLFMLPLFFFRFPMTPPLLDFTEYFVAARIGIEHGFSHIYDATLQQPLFDAVRPGPVHFGWRTLYATPPPMAWIVAPLSFLGLPAAYWAWTAISLGSFLGVAVLVAPGDGLTRAVHITVALGLYPVLLSLQLGQVTLVIAAAIGLAWWLAERGRDWQAGLVLVVVILKPQVGVLVPITLGLMGRRRLFGVWAAAAAMVTLAALVSLGPSGIRQYMETLHTLGSQPGVTSGWSLASWVGFGAPATVLEAVCGLVVLATAFMARRGPIGLGVVAGVLGGLLAFGYHNPVDFAPLAMAAWIQFRSSRYGWEPWLLAMGVVASATMPRFGPRPVFLFLLTWLALLAWSSVTRRPAPAEVSAAV